MPASVADHPLPSSPASGHDVEVTVGKAVLHCAFHCLFDFGDSGDTIEIHESAENRIVVLPEGCLRGSDTTLALDFLPSQVKGIDFLVERFDRFRNINEGFGAGVDWADYLRG